MAYVRRQWVDYPNTTTPIDADALNNIEDGIEESHNIQLLAVTDTAPSECAEGDKYYDTTTGLIYTATGTDEWGETGETPIYDILYIVLDEQTSYTYNGTTLVSVGGGSSAGGGETLPVGSEIDYDGSTVPTGWEEMTDYDSGWIEITPSIGTAGTGYYVPMYRKIGNVVYLRGQITGVTQRTTEMFALPSNFYNTSARMTFCTTNDTLEINFVRVLNTGIVQLQRTTGTLENGITVYLDGICFTID